TKISALTAVSSVVAAQEFAVNDAGTSKKANSTQISTFMRNSLFSASTANQALSGTADTYVTGSNVGFTASRLQAGTIFRCKFKIEKTASANTVGPVFNLRIGTAGSTADTSRGTFTFTVGTNVVDKG